MYGYLYPSFVGISLLDCINPKHKENMGNKYATLIQINQIKLNGNALSFAVALWHKKKTNKHTRTRTRTRTQAQSQICINTSKTYRIHRRHV